MDDEGGCRGAKGKTLAHSLMGVGVGREKTGQGEERIDVYTIPEPGKQQTSGFHHRMAFSWLTREGVNVSEE
jgi:hypothetical protein